MPIRAILELWRFGSILYYVSICCFNHNHSHNQTIIYFFNILWKSRTRNPRFDSKINELEHYLYYIELFVFFFNSLSNTLCSEPLIVFFNFKYHYDYDLYYCCRAKHWWSEWSTHALYPPTLVPSTPIGLITCEVASLLFFSVLIKRIRKMVNF